MIPESLLNNLEHPRRREAGETADFPDDQLVKAGIIRISIKAIAALLNQNLS